MNNLLTRKRQTDLLSKAPFFLAVSVFTAAILFLCNIQQTWASDQSDCFDTLKTNAGTISLFDPAMSTLASMTYSDVETDFSRYYKSDSLILSPAVNDVNNPTSQLPRFEYRIYSFGAQTGYIHPPRDMSTPAWVDSWDTAAKEHIIMEEYIVDSAGTRSFISCGLITMEADDLMAVTADKIDVETLGQSVYTEDATNRIWYTDGTSYGEQCFAADWKRLFVAPESASLANISTAPFTRYDFIELVAALVTDFSSVNVAHTDLTPPCPRKSLFASNILVAVTDGTSRTTSITSSGNKRLYDAYSKLQNKFPNSTFTTAGGLSIDTVQKMIQEESPDFIRAIYATVPSYTELLSYYESKQAGSITANAVYDAFIEDPKTYEEAIMKRLDDIKQNPELIEQTINELTENQNRNASSEPEQKNANEQRNTNSASSIPGTTEVPTSTEQPIQPTSLWIIWLIAVVTFILIFFAFFIIKSQKVRSITVIAIIILALVCIAIIFFTVGKSTQASVLGNARQSQKFADHCIENLEFNEPVHLSSSDIPSNGAITPALMGDLITMEIHGWTSTGNKYISLCENNNILIMLPTYKARETDVEHKYKIYLRLRTVLGGMNIEGATYVTGVDSNGDEITEQAGTICNVACDLNKPDKLFTEVEYLDQNMLMGTIGCFTPETTSHTLLTSYDVSHTLYSTTKPKDTSLNRGAFTLENYEPFEKVTYQVVTPPLPPPPRTSGN